MRNLDNLTRRNNDIGNYFNQKYKEMEHGTHAARYNVALHATAARFYLSIRTVSRVLKNPSAHLSESSLLEVA
jgi:hypothetical protein